MDAKGSRLQGAGARGLGALLSTGKPWFGHVGLSWDRRVPFLIWSQPDTLLNVFLAIAVDNLANAQELTKVGTSPADPQQRVRVALSLCVRPESLEEGLDSEPVGPLSKGVAGPLFGVGELPKEA